MKKRKWIIGTLLALALFGEAGVADMQLTGTQLAEVQTVQSGYA